MSFPVEKSILSTRHLQDFVQKNYLCAKKATCKLIKTWINDTYLFETAHEKYIFRVYTFNWRSLLEIQAEVELILHLKEQGIGVSFPIPDDNGKLVQEFVAPEGMRYGVLFSFAEGPLQWQLPPSSHFDIGKLMAEIHQHTNGITISRKHYSLKNVVTDPFEKINTILKQPSSEKDFFLEAKKYLEKELNQQAMIHQRTGVVHLDIWADNLRIDDQGKVTLFDFDFCGNGWLAYDLAYYALMLFTIESDKEQYEEKLSVFYRGYESVWSITAEEKESLKLLAPALCYFYMCIQCQRFSEIYVNESYLRQFINSRLKAWWEYHQLPLY